MTNEETMTAKKNVPFTPTERKRMNAFCTERRLSANDLIRRLVAEYIEKAGSKK